MFNGKLTKTEIVIRDGVNYEKKTFENNGAISTQERAVTKASYDLPIARKTAELELLQSLQADCSL